MPKTRNRQYTKRVSMLYIPTHDFRDLVVEGDTARVMFMLSWLPYNTLDHFDNGWAYTALALAVHNRHTELVRVLLMYYNIPNDQERVTGLATQTSPNILLLLLRHGFTLTPSQVLRIWEYGNICLLSLILTVGIGVDPPNGVSIYSPLRYAYRYAMRSDRFIGFSCQPV